MRKIYKYVIGTHGEFSIPIQKDAEFLHVGIDPTGQACMWWMIDDLKQLLNYSFRVAFTGEEYGENADTYLGTFHVGGLVCHLFHNSY